MRAAATALLVLLLVAPARTQESNRAQTPPAVDRALVIRFVEAGEAQRRTLITDHPEILSAPFRESLAVLGNAQKNNGDLDAAEICFRALLFVALEHHFEPSEAIAYNNLGSVYGIRGDLDTAADFLRRAMAIGERTNNIKDVQAAWGNLGIIQRKRGDLDLAEASMRRALAMAQSNNDKGLEAKTLNNLGLVYRDRGDAASAQKYYLLSLKLKEEINAPPREMGTTLTNLGGIFDDQGDYAQALHYYMRGYDLMMGAGVPDASIGPTLNNLGHLYSQLGRNDEAREFYTRALAATEKAGERGIQGTLLYNFGTLAEAEKNFDESESLQLRALALREEVGDRRALAESLSGLAHLMDARSRPAEGLPFALRAVSLAEQSGLLNELWKAQFAEAHLRDVMGDAAGAAAAYAASIATIEKIRSAAAGGDAGRRDYLAELVGPYYGLATLKAKNGDGWGALQVMEQSRARALIDIVTSGRQATRNMTPAQRERERAILQTITVVSDAVDTESRKSRPNAAKLKDLQAQLSKARVDHDVVTAELYAQSPDLGFARGVAPAITRDDLAALLSPSVAVVSYVFDRDAVWAYIVRRRDSGVEVTTKRLSADRIELRHKSETFAKQIAARDLGFGALAHELYASLIRPIEPSIAGASHLIVIPDGPLWSVPFQALMSGRGRFLIEDHALSYTPSLSALDVLERRRASRPVRAPFVLALGDPAVSSAGAASSRSDGGRLPEAAREVQEVGKLYGASRSRILTDAAASEAALRANLNAATIVHLATHGVLDDTNPMYSRLLLNSGGDASTADHATDGRLEAWEILDLGFNADLAVLSACDTARGGFGWGEGVIGLSWSLFAAGASTAIVSEWQVDSSSTTRLMIAFHRQLQKAGKTERPDSAAALRTAAMQLLSLPASRHPFYWAGFIAVGAK